MYCVYSSEMPRCNLALLEAEKVQKKGTYESKFCLRWDFVKINKGGLFPEDQKNKVSALRNVWFFFKKEQFFSELIRLLCIILII